MTRVYETLWLSKVSCVLRAQKFWSFKKSSECSYDLGRRTFTWYQNKLERATEIERAIPPYEVSLMRTWEMKEQQIFSEDAKIKRVACCCFLLCQLKNEVSGHFSPFFTVNAKMNSSAIQKIFEDIDRHRMQRVWFPFKSKKETMFVAKCVYIK